MVRDELWRSVVLADHNFICRECPDAHVVRFDYTMLCIACLERRLGRGLCDDDFTMKPR